MTDFCRYRKYAGNKFRILDEKFIQNFDEEAMVEMIMAAKY